MLLNETQRLLNSHWGNHTKNMKEKSRYQTWTKHNKARIVCIFLAVHSKKVFNSLFSGKWGCNFKISNFQTHNKERYHEQFLWNCPQVNATKSPWSLVKLVQVIVPSGNKALPEPVSTQIYVCYYGVIRAQWVNDINLATHLLTVWCGLLNCDFRH